MPMPTFEQMMKLPNYKLNNDSRWTIDLGEEIVSLLINAYCRGLRHYHIDLRETEKDQALDWIQRHQGKQVTLKLEHYDEKGNLLSSLSETIKVGDFWQVCNHGGAEILRFEAEIINARKSLNFGDY